MYNILESFQLLNLRAFYFVICICSKSVGTDLWDGDGMAVAVSSAAAKFLAACGDRAHDR